MTKTEISIGCLSYIYCHCFLINISVSSRIGIGMKKESAQKTTFLLFVCMTKLLCPERKLHLMVWFHCPVHMDSHCVLHIYSVFMCFVIYCLGLWTSLPPARWYFISLTCLISCRDGEIDCDFGYRDRLSGAGKGSVLELQIHPASWGQHSWAGKCGVISSQLTAESQTRINI